MTNADKIRKMTDEELAIIIMCPYEYNGISEACSEMDVNDVTKTVCNKCCEKWLKQEVEE